jgi:hypothetical protein
MMQRSNVATAHRTGKGFEGKFTNFFGRGFLRDLIGSAIGRNNGVPLTKCSNLSG